MEEVLIRCGEVMKKKICVVSGTRAEFGLLSRLLEGITQSESLELQLVVTGMHLSAEFGMTHHEIEERFKIHKKIEILLSSDTPVGLSKSVGLAQISFGEAFAELKPDLVVILGDRFEVFGVASAAMLGCIPIAHLHGGEATFGLIDEAIRHSISKMSHLHFTSAEPYRQRVIQLGESPDRVFNVGAMGVDNILSADLVSREELESSIGFKLKTKNMIVTFHPVTLNIESAEGQFKELLKAIDRKKEYGIIFTKGNADTDGRIINQLIDEYVGKNSERSVVFNSLGFKRYLSTLKNTDFVLGNSSSGIIEAPYFRIPTINIGDRQEGRIKAKSVIQCNPDSDEILKSIEVAEDESFLSELQTMELPYGKGGAAKKIIEVLEKTSFESLLKKKFYNLENKK